MLILAVDTAGDACSVALCDGDGWIAGATRPMRHGHAEALMPMVVDALATAQVGFDAIDLYAVTVGPGAFTGLRVGIAAVAGMALAGDRPIVGVDSFLAMAAAVPAEARRGHDLLVAIDSRRGDPYLQVLDQDLAPVGPAWCGPPGDPLARHLRDRPILAAGSAAERIAGRCGDRTIALAAAPATPPAAVVAALAARDRTRAGPGVPQPVYLRPPDARVPPPGRGVAPAGAASPIAVTPVGATAADLLSALHGCCFGAPGWTAEAMAALLATPGTVALIATAGEEPVGLAMGRAAADEAEVITIATDPGHRRRGIGRQLLRGLIDALAGRGARAVFLEVDARNGAAQALYAAAGFVAVGRRAGYYRDAEGHGDALVLRRDIAGD